MELEELIYQAGIVGCGGAGFPTHMKYKGGQIETIIINGAECEPLLQTDCYVMRNHAAELVKAADTILKVMEAAVCIIALKRTYIKEIAAIKSAIERQKSQVRIHLLDSFYPAGDEQTMVYEVTGKTIPPSGLPLETGCIVSNVTTLYHIGEALNGSVFTQKYLTITGVVRSPIIAKVPIGTPVSECLNLAGGVAVSNYVVLNGGPMMGKILTMEEAEKAYVTKTMSGLIVLPAEAEIATRSRISLTHMLNRAKSVCIQCSYCTQLCPRALLGHPLMPHRIMRLVASRGISEEILREPIIQNTALCCECGVCEIYACPMGLQPRAINTELKNKLRKNGIRFERSSEPCSAVPEREMRKIPTARVAARAGVSGYEKIEIDNMREINPQQLGKVVLSLQQGIGKSSSPVVKTGDYVTMGQLIAISPEGQLGASLHASISGKVVVEDAYITISTNGELEE